MSPSTVKIAREHEYIQCHDSCPDLASAQYCRGVCTDMFLTLPNTEISEFSVRQTTPLLEFHKPADDIVLCPIHAPLVPKVLDGVLDQFVVRKLLPLP
jgi:hypothetical protein